MPPLAVLAILALFLVLAAVAIYAEDLAAFAPRRTRALKGAAQRFCLDRCRLENDACPLTAYGMDRESCPLWRFVHADLSTNLPTDSSEPIGPAPRATPSA